MLTNTLTLYKVLKYLTTKDLFFRRILHMQFKQTHTPNPKLSGYTHSEAPVAGMVEQAGRGVCQMKKSLFWGRDDQKSAYPYPRGQKSRSSL